MGRAAIILIGDTEQIITGRDADTTNNRMELTAAIRALEELPQGLVAVVHSDLTKMPVPSQGPKAGSA